MFHYWVIDADGPGSKYRAFACFKLFNYTGRTSEMLIFFVTIIMKISRLIMHVFAFLVHSWFFRVVSVYYCLKILFFKLVYTNISTYLLEFSLFYFAEHLYEIVVLFTVYFYSCKDFISCAQNLGNNIFALHRSNVLN